MNIKVKEYISEYLPKKCGVHPSCGVTAWLVFCEEQNGNQAYAADKFKSARDRARMGMPYKPARGCGKEYEKGLDVLEQGILVHGQFKHLENNQREIGDLQSKRIYNEVEISVLATADWWSA